MWCRNKIRVLLIDQQDDFLALVIVRCLQETGQYDLHCITADPAHRLRRSIRCRIRFEPLESPSALLDAVQRYNEMHPIDVVIPIQEAMIKMAGEVAGAINAFTKLVSLPSPDLCDAIDNKWRFEKMLSSTSIKMPRSLLSDGDRSTLEQTLSSWSGEFLTKPVNGYGGVGIHQHETREALLETLRNHSSMAEEPILIQEFIPGTDMGCSFISREGKIIALTIQQVILAQTKAYTSGLGLEFVQNDTISAIAEEFARASNWSGVANMDLRLDDRTGDVYLLEVNPRYWQTLLGSLAMGVNFPDLHCRLALGQPVEVRPARFGRWVNTNLFSTDIVNLKRFLACPECSWRCVNIRSALSDPLIEILPLLNGVRRHIRVKVRASLRQIRKNIVPSKKVVD